METTLLTNSTSQVKYNEDLIKKAYNFAYERHKGQVRKNGVAYINHPIGVANLLDRVTKDPEMVIAGLLHDIIEDTETTYREIHEMFGERVTQLVQEVTIDVSTKKSMGKRKYMVMRINQISDDAFTLKLCDRLDNVHDLDDNTIDINFAKWYWKETKYLLERIDRNVSIKQIVLINRIDSMLDYLKTIHVFNYSNFMEE